jgi:L-alanine-DL-glutamate epimerase-like enolase superfamily enzyme
VFDADAVGPEVPALAKAGDAPAENSAAKAAIEADGYRNAKVVRQGENGIWYAKAMRGTTEVSLTVDATGRVSLE